MILREQAGKLYRILRNYLYRPNPNATLLFGLHKSGTSAAIKLIAFRAGISFFDDFPYRLGDWDDVMKGNLKLISYVNKHSYAFSRELIRYPIEPKAIDLATSFFKMNKYIVTVRNPIDNIKSILSRLKIRGDLNELNVSKLDCHSNWLKMLSKRDNYIDSLIQCWLEAYDQLEWINSNHCVLFKYEDFVKDKKGYITDKVIELGYKPKKSIDHFVEIQYQPKGTNVSNREFFGRKNLEKIISAIHSLAFQYGYDLTESRNNG